MGLFDREPRRRTAPAPEPSAPMADGPVRRVVLDLRSVWRAGLVLLGVVALGAFGRFVLHEGSHVLVTIALAWLAALAMEPAVGRLSRRIPRGAAVAVVMAGLGVLLAVFLAVFGAMLADQVAQLIQTLPDVVQSIIGWVNTRFGTEYSVDTILQSINLTPSDAAGYANQVLGGVLGILGSVVGVLFTGLTLLLLTFYFSADNPRLRVWIGGLLPARQQQVFITVWNLTTEKTGGYVAARAVLATLNGVLTSIVFLIFGLPSWLALGLWTGLVAQFVPTIGTYISIALPLLVAVLSDRPWTALVVLGWAVLYQQVENLAIEPRISARAVNVHPAVAFSSVLFGTALFGITGALLSIPIFAMLLSLLDIYAKRHDLIPELAAEDAALPPKR